MAEAILAGRVDQGGDEIVERAHRFSDLSEYSFSQRFSIRAADLGFYGIISLIGRTVRFEIEGQEHWAGSTRGGHIPIYTFWHDCIFLSTYYWRRRGIVVMTSQSFDGEYIARFIQRFGYGAAKGSSTRGARAGLIQMIRAVRAGKSAAFTVDGPRGPIYQAKPGAVMLAAKAGAAILPFSISLTRCWRAEINNIEIQLTRHTIADFISATT